MNRGLVIALLAMSICLFSSCGGLAGLLSGKADSSQTKDQKNMEITETIRKPHNDRLEFSGYQWRTKTTHTRYGPGPNYFSDDEGIWVDGQERLHMQITQIEGRWHCAEVISEESFGYGTYRFYIDNRTDDLDSNVVLGLFTWSDEPAYNHREIDVECSRWGDTSINSKNTQFVVQPYNLPGRMTRFKLMPSVDKSLHSFAWTKDNVSFQSVEGHNAIPIDSRKVIKQWTCTKGIPRAGGENARINLWLVEGKAPKNNGRLEVIISKFEFIPLR